MSLSAYAYATGVLTCLCLCYTYAYGLLCFSFESCNTVTRTLYMRQNCSNGLQKRFGDIKRTPQRDFELYRSFSRENRNIFRSKFKSIQALISTSYGTLWLPVIRHFEPDHSALVKLGSKRVYVSVSVKHNCTRFYGISR